MHDHHHAHAAEAGFEEHAHDETIPIARWLEETTHLTDEAVNEFRMVAPWDEAKWQEFPDAGTFQPTRLTSETSAGNASAIWLKLEPGEGFDPHRHPNAIHTMTVFDGEADLFWKQDDTVYSTTMRVGGMPNVVLPSMPHAIVANRQTRVVMLVINTPPDDVHKHDYATPVQGA